MGAQEKMAAEPGQEDIKTNEVAKKRGRKPKEDA
jgi:hypothetical protein